jgi:hypothetical protein
MWPFAALRHFATRKITVPVKPMSFLRSVPSVKPIKFIAKKALSDTVTNTYSTP